MSATRGFSLVEFLVAIFILGVAVLAFGALQASSLRGGKQGQELQSTLKSMENFLERVRTRPGDLPSLCAGAVQIGRARGKCSYTSCALSPGGGVVCGGNSSLAPLYKVRLEVGNRVLETLVYAP